VSTDAWRWCPRCFRNQQEAARLARKEAEGAYGNASPAEYEALLVKAQELEAAVAVSEYDHPKPTMREDYEIYTKRDGTFYVSYSAGCQECGFSFHFKETRDTEPAGTTWSQL